MANATDRMEPAAEFDLLLGIAPGSSLVLQAASWLKAFVGVHFLAPGAYMEISHFLQLLVLLWISSVTVRRRGHVSSRQHFVSKDWRHLSFLLFTRTRMLTSGHLMNSLGFDYISASKFISQFLSFPQACDCEATSYVKKLLQKKTVLLENLGRDYTGLSFWTRFTWRWTNPLFLKSVKSRIGSGDLLQKKTVPLNTDYNESSLWSKVTFRWMNSLFLKGFKLTLGTNDIPKLPPDCEAYCLQSTFLQQFSSDKPNALLSRVLVHCFWKDFLLTGLLAFCKAAVMYIGPALITTFVKHATNHKDLSHLDLKGYLLVTILLVSKYFDVLTSHHFTFRCQKLGLQVRSTLTSAVFRKGLGLSNSARQEHGLGQVANYMSVDVPQVANTIGALHNIWMLPLQITVALTILYSVIGLAMLAGVATMVILVTFATWTSRLQRRNQSALLDAKDSRLKATNEVLTSMKVIKLLAWESFFLKKLASRRATEFSCISKIVWTMGSVMTIRLLLSGALVSIATFVSCLFLGIELTPGKVFTAIATLRLLQDPIRVFPITVNDLCKAQVSLQRLEAYLHSNELDAKLDTISGLEECVAISVAEGQFSWEDSNCKKRIVLRDMNVNVKNGELVACVGAVGSGKSSFLACMLGEMHKLHGQVQVRGSMAYVPQTPWIQNGTVEDNILFGKLMNRSKYEEALEVCQLVCDIASLEHGDQTEIGERGVNLSGGQKQRIQLARAVYQDSDVYLLDDIFSSVDAHTGSAIFRVCVKGVLREKTIILVTHQVEFLQEVDRILVMCDGTVTESGKYEDLRGCSTNFEALVTAHKKAVEKSGFETSEGQAHTCEQSATQSKSEKRKTLDSNNANKTISRKIIEEEQWETCRPGNYKVYWLYATKTYGSWCVLLLFVVQGIWQTLSIWGDYWLADVTQRKETFDPRWFIGVYALFNLGTWMCVLIRTSLGMMAGARTAQEYYDQMLGSLLRAPMSFFDTTPSSRILNRSSADQSVLDVTLPSYFGSGLSICFTLLGTLFVMCQTSWPIIFIILPLAYLYFMYQAYFIATSRQLTRMRSESTALILHHFSESIAGSTVIRCFQRHEFFYQKNRNSLNENLRMVFHSNAASAWLAYRLEMIGTIVLCSSALLLVLLPNRWVPPQLVGLSLSYGLSLNGALYWTVWLFCELETHMVAVERVKQYTEIPSEEPADHVADIQLPTSSNWPSVGAIALQNLQVRYQPGTPLVLKGITVTILGGEKVGVVGRTGSGKSTFMQALLRIVEPAGGRILIDGIDIAIVGLSRLRSSFGIIPQEPTLFEGTVRTNIDPLGRHGDEEIWEALRDCQLAEFVQGQPEQLAAPVMNGGDNWSVGRKQLLCLGRAFLKRARIMVFDEASASIDSRTDELIRRAIRTGFTTSTVVNITHRIPTIGDSDRVIVLQAGRVREFNAPQTLMAQPKSLFRSMVREYSAQPGARH